MSFGAVFRVEDDLNETFTITKIDENDSAMIPAAVHPAHENDAFSNFFAA
jgi:hypothetical protein